MKDSPWLEEHQGANEKKKKRKIKRDEKLRFIQRTVELVFQNTLMNVRKSWVNDN